MGIKVIKPRRLGAVYRCHRRGGADFLAVAVLAMFPLADPKALANEQQLWSLVPAELGDTPLDLGLPKPRGEVMLVGSCRPAGGRPVTQAEVSLRLGALEKTILVFGDRVWTRNPDHFDRLVGKGWLAGPPQPFQEMPLDWAHAFGGPHYPLNPLGKGHHRPEDGPPREGDPLPNLELPRQMVANPWSTPLPATLGPIPIDWPQRARGCGTFDSHWLREQFPGPPLDADPGMFNAAPEDQQREGFWQGDEQFVLQGVDPDRPRLEGSLPGLRPRCFLNRHPERLKPQEISLALETVWFFTRQGMGVLLWRGETRVESWDAKEVRQMLVACEYLAGAARSPADYRLSMERRLDRSQARYWLLREDDLLPPEGLEQARPLEMSPPPPPGLPPQAEEELHKAERLREKAAGSVQKVGEEVKKARQRFSELARRFEIDPDKHLPPEPEVAPPPKVETVAPPPPPPPVLGPQDLPAVMTYLQTEIPRLRSRLQALPRKDPPDPLEMKEKAERARAQAEERLRSLGKRFGVDMDQKLQEAAQSSPPDTLEVLRKLRGDLDRLPRAPGQTARHDQKIAEAKQKLDQAIEQLAKDRPAKPQTSPKPADPKQFPRKLSPQELQARCKGGHYLEPEAIPEDRRRRAGEIVQQKLAAGESLEGWDLSGAVLKGLDLRGADLKGTLLAEADLRRADLAGADLSGAVLVRARLGGAKLGGAKLSGANLGKTELSGAELSGCDLGKAILEEADLTGARLVEARLEGCNLIRLRAPKADFSRARMDKATFLDAELGGARFTEAELGGARFLRCGLEAADFSRARMVKAVLVAARGRGACFAGAEMERVRMAMACCFAQGDFRQVNSQNGNWRECDLGGADFRQARLEGSDFGRSHLAGADFYHARARKTRFDDCDLQGASLLAVDLMEGSLMAARLQGADLRYSNLFGVNFIAAQGDEHTRWEGADLNRTLITAMQKET